MCTNAYSTIILQVLATDQNINTIKLSFSAKVNDHHLLENASTHWVGVGANSGDEMLWVGQDAITFSKVTMDIFNRINQILLELIFALPIVVENNALYNVSFRCSKLD